MKISDSFMVDSVKDQKQSPHGGLQLPKGLQIYCNETPTQVFNCEFSKSFKNTYFYRTPLAVASERWSRIFQRNTRILYSKLDQV